MRPLLWKEMRDLRWWLVGGAAMLGAIEVLFGSAKFCASFEGSYLPFLMPLLLVLVAVGLGAGQIARERHVRSLDYLRSRPISPGTIVWAKFLAGTVVLALLTAGIVGLGYYHPEQMRDTAVRAIHETAGYQALALTLFPRYWCLYALALLASVLVDRAVKSAALLVVGVVTLLGWSFGMVQLAPFSNLPYWLPWIDPSGGLLLAAKSVGVSLATGAVFSAVALATAAAAAGLLRRSPERYVGYAGLTALGLGIVGAAVASAHGAAVRLAEVRPLGTATVHVGVDEQFRRLVAAGGLVALTFDEGVEFFDFANPAAPKELGTVRIPLFQNTESDWYTGKGALWDGAVFIEGRKKSLPVDQMEIAIVRPSGAVDEISLGPVRQDGYATPVVIDGYLYAGVTHERQCTVRVFEVASHREVATLTVDQLRPARMANENEVPFTFHRRGSFLYAATASSLTAIDVRDPARPVVTDRVAFQPRLSFLYGYPRVMESQGDRLLQRELWPLTIGTYDLRDPAHPVRSGDLGWHEDAAITGSGSALYRAWQKGVLEFRVAGEELRAERYLSGGAAVTSVATDGNLVYAFTSEDAGRKQTVQAFRVQ